MNQRNEEKKARTVKVLAVTQRHATGQIVKRPGFPAPCINASQRLRAWPTAKVLAYFRGIGNTTGSETERSGAA